MAESKTINLADAAKKVAQEFDAAGKYVGKIKTDAEIFQGQNGIDKQMAQLEKEAKQILVGTAKNILQGIGHGLDAMGQENERER